MSVRGGLRGLGSLLLALLAGALAPPSLVADSRTEPEAAPPQRIVALAPNVVELLFALELGDHVVGVGDFCRFPPEIEDLPHLGGLVDPHYEEIVALAPDLVVTLASESDLAHRMKRLGIPGVTVEIETLDDVPRAAETIAQAAGAPEAGREFRESFTAHLEPLTLAGTPSVLFLFGRPSGELGEVMTAGDDTYLTEIVERLGARNAFADAIGRYPRIGLEEILRRNPDWIVELQWESLTPDEAEALRSDWTRFSTLQAVRRDRIVVIDGDFTVIPGPRLTELYDALRHALHGRDPP